ncbi:MAG TPA: SurA N-terminal domain-containing protein, partial [Syntrophales bacterium]|nr:SurA N-terminal domain-containing protein [Syntrophales bacterium]
MNVSLKIKCAGKRRISSSGRRILCVFVFVLLIAGCGGNGDSSKQLATVGDMTITVAEFNQRFARDVNFKLDKSTLSPADIDRLKEEILNILIDEKVMLLCAK